MYDRIVRNHFDFLRKQREQIRIRAERAAAQQKSEFVTMVSHGAAPPSAAPLWLSWKSLPAPLAAPALRPPARPRPRC